MTLSDIKTSDQFRHAWGSGLLECVGTGSERGYVHVGCIVVCGIVRTGFRHGLLKVQLGGRGGPFRNSTQYTDNRYYRLKHA